MSDKMRSEFEAWAKSLPFANMERHLDGYLNQSINSFWSVWQASRAALVVELPSGQALLLSDVCESLDSAGVKYK